MSDQLTITVGEVELTCDYDYSPSTPDVMYLPNGDPGYPGDPEEFTVNSAIGEIDGQRVDVLNLLAKLGDCEDIISYIEMCVYKAMAAKHEEDADDAAAEEARERFRPDY